MKKDDVVRNEECVDDEGKYPPKLHKSFGYPKVMMHFTKYGIPKLGWLQRDLNNKGKTWEEANDGVEAGAYTPYFKQNESSPGAGSAEWGRIAFVYLVGMPIYTFWQSPRWRYGMKAAIASNAIGFGGIFIGLPVLLLIPVFWMLHEVGHRLLKRDGYQDIVVEYWGFGKEPSNAAKHIAAQNVLTTIYALYFSKVLILLI